MKYDKSYFHENKEKSSKTLAIVVHINMIKHILFFKLNKKK